MEYICLIGDNLQKTIKLTFILSKKFTEENRFSIYMPEDNESVNTTFLEPPILNEVSKPQAAEYELAAM